MWLQPNADASRYGTVELDAGTGEVTAFLEKGRSGEGLISCGVYLVERSVIESIPEGRPVSLEQDVFPRLAGLYGIVGSGAVLGIGAPEALAQAAKVFPGEIMSLQTESPPP